MRLAKLVEESRPSRARCIMPHSLRETVRLRTTTLAPEEKADSTTGDLRIDEKELQAILEREFGPIRRPQYSAAVWRGRDSSTKGPHPSSGLRETPDATFPVPGKALRETPDATFPVPGKA